ncbi:MAG: glycosyltransferase family 4 protein [Chloroflexota bacterium]
MHKLKIMPSIAIVQRSVPYYRVPFFNLLTKRNPDLEIKVCHGSKTVTGTEKPSFNSCSYRNYTVNLFGYSLVLQPKLMVHLILSQPDLVVLEGTFGVLTNFVLLFVRWLTRRPTLYWTAGWDNPEILSWRRLLKSWVIRLSLGMCSGAIVYGSAARDYLVAHGLSTRKIVIAQNTINVEQLIQDYDYWVGMGQEIRQRFASTVKKVIVYVGHLSPIKRVEALLKSFAAIRRRRSDVALLIVGNGSQAAELIRFVEVSETPDVHFAGEVVDGVEAYFAASDLFVLPGTGGLAINQAMALGLPVVTTIADGTEKDLVIPGENGDLVPVDDVEALSKAIEGILTSPSLEQMKRNAQRIIQERATLHNMVEQFTRAIRQQLETRR